VEIIKITPVYQILEPEIGAVFFCILGTLTAICASKGAMTGLSAAAERDDAVHDSHLFSPIG